MTLLDVAHKLNVALPTVSIRAKKEGWLKLAQQAAERDMAHQITDVIGQISGRDELLDKVGASLDISVRSRVAAINRWRDDWAKHRVLFTPEACASDPVASKRGKATAEMMMMRQRGEAVAFGLSTLTGMDTNAPLVEQDVDDVQPKSQLDRVMEHFLRTGELPTQPPLTIEAPDDTQHQ